MKSGQQLLFGGAMAVMSGIILVGSILLSFTENGYALAPLPSESSTITALPVGTILANVEVESQITPPSNTFVPPMATATFTPNPECPLPVGYVVYVVKSGESLQDLAAWTKVSVGTLVKANCFESGDLTSEYLAVGMKINLPAVIAIPTSAVCSAPRGWVVYTIQQGDTLFALGQALGIHWTELQQANCMGASIGLTAGKYLYVPHLPYAMPYPSATFPPTVTLAPTFTQAAPATNPAIPSEALPPLATDRSLPASATATIAPAATATSIPLPSLTPAPTNPPAPSAPPAIIATNTPVPEPTDVELVVSESPKE